MINNPVFESLRLDGWRHIENVSVGFHETLTILTGANGTGKTTILNVLSRHFGWNFVLTSSRRKSKVGKTLEYIQDYWGPAGAGESGSQNTPTTKSIGSIMYTNGMASSIDIPHNQNVPTYHLNIPNQVPVQGLHLPSHRPTPVYRPVASIPTQAYTKESAFNNYKSEIIRRLISGGRSDKPPSLYVKETLIALITWGHGNAQMPPDEQALSTVKGFEEVLRNVLPASFGFKQFSVRIPELMMETDTGDVNIDAVSGGISSLIDIAYQIYMFSPVGQRYVVTLDEPENHLHPQMQQELLPNLIRAFPLVQFVVVTHSPLVVGSVPESSVYVLDYNASKRVYSQKLDLINRAGTANEVLMGVLGIDSAAPKWVSSAIEGVIDRYSKLPATPENLSAMTDELREKGLSNMVTETLARVINSSGPAGA